MGGAASRATAVGINADFVREVEQLMKPGTSALFVLDDQGNLDAILHTIRGLGGTILQIERQLAACQADSIDSRRRGRRLRLKHLKAEAAVDVKHPLAS